MQTTADLVGCPAGSCSTTAAGCSNGLIESFTTPIKVSSALWPLARIRIDVRATVRDLDEHPAAGVQTDRRALGERRLWGRDRPLSGQRLRRHPRGRRPELRDRGQRMTPGAALSDVGFVLGAAGGTDAAGDGDGAGTGVVVGAAGDAGDGEGAADVAVEALTAATSQ